MALGLDDGQDEDAVTVRNVKGCGKRKGLQIVVRRWLSCFDHLACKRLDALLIDSSN